MRKISLLVAGVVMAAIVSGPSAAGAQVGWAVLQWTDADGRWHSLEYDRSTVGRVGSTLAIRLRRDREEAMRQDPLLAPGAHPWTRQEIELDCVDEIWRVVHWEARDETGTLLASGGGEGWLPIRAHGFPRTLERRLCPWP